MANIFLSVVGTGDYAQTEYRLGDTSYKKERYVQKALLSLLKAKGEHFDKIIFFLTPKAGEKNWEEFTASRPNKDGITETDEGLRPFLESEFPEHLKLWAALAQSRISSYRLRSMISEIPSFSNRP